MTTQLDQNEAEKEKQKAQKEAEEKKIRKEDEARRKLIKKTEEALRKMKEADKASQKSKLEKTSKAETKPERTDLKPSQVPTDTPDTETQEDPKASATVLTDDHLTNEMEEQDPENEGDPPTKKAKTGSETTGQTHTGTSSTREKKDLGTPDPNTETKAGGGKPKAASRRSERMNKKNKGGSSSIPSPKEKRKGKTSKNEKAKKDAEEANSLTPLTPLPTEKDTNRVIAGESGDDSPTLTLEMKDTAQGL
jgi:hypothetical protein